MDKRSGGWQRPKWERGPARLSARLVIIPRLQWWSNGTKVVGRSSAQGGSGVWGTGGSVFYSVKFGIGQAPNQKLDILTSREMPTYLEANRELSPNVEVPAVDLAA